MYFLAYFSLKKAGTSITEIGNNKRYKNFMFHNTVFRTIAMMVP